jgi:hypothetical protein
MISRATKYLHEEAIMRWGRGFFRLWVAVTIIWMAGVAAILGTEHFKGLWSPDVKFEVTYKGGFTDTLDGSRTPEHLKQQIIEDVKMDAALLVKQGNSAEAKKQIEDAATNADQLLKALADEKAQRSDRWPRALAVMLAPPFGLLVLGLTIAWIARGFRKAVAS